MKRHFYEAVDSHNPIIRLGFWPGGDRDGNPFVNTGITLKVAEELRKSILKCYYLDIRKLRRRLTFKGVTKPLALLENQLYQMVFLENQTAEVEKESILQHLLEVRLVLKADHNSLFIHLVEDLINKVHVFGQHFASLDIRQDSSLHSRLLVALAEKELGLPRHYPTMPVDEKIALLTHASPIPSDGFVNDPQLQDILEAMRAIRTIQAKNGEPGCHRYIISHCGSALQVMEVLGLLRLSGWEEKNIPIDIVPLFETIDDLDGAAAIMEALYNNEAYRSHIAGRGHCQTVMLGFSDGTKDGGYFTANWSIYKAKDRLSHVSRKHNVEALFFDGRGGPPSRGGGKTHRFYASLGQNIANREIQLTIQGQTVSSNFGTIDAAQFNMEQLIDAGISSTLLESKLETFTPVEEQWMEALSKVANQAYLDLRNHPQFLPYLAHMSPLRFYADTNIGSRPSRRGSAGQLSLKDLRAIPYVGAWSQLKQNVTGFYGVGAALQNYYENGGWSELESLYQNSLFFRTLLDNCEMVMEKCYFPLTRHLANHPQYGEIWHMIFEEYERTLRMVKLLSKHRQLMENYPVEQLSVRMRERIILPLLTIQQYGLMRLANPEGMDEWLHKKLEKLVMRCSFGIINAGRNSA
jgi:phosphoenolpyruvate carboxylase